MNQGEVQLFQTKTNPSLMITQELENITTIHSLVSININERSFVIID
jgi:hypothetical protein